MRFTSIPVHIPITYEAKQTQLFRKDWQFLLQSLVLPKQMVVEVYTLMNAING